jgi:catechol 2,3-dioxygenase-like lactoylglutathione lyase family enzyme
VPPDRPSAHSPGLSFTGPILLAARFAPTVSFYRDVLGLPVEGSEPYARCVSPHANFSIADGRWWVQVNGSENPSQAESSVANTVLRVSVPDVEAEFERLMARGVRFLNPPTASPEMGVRTAFLRDPDGRWVMLTSPLA